MVLFPCRMRRTKPSSGSTVSGNDESLSSTLGVDSDFVSTTWIFDILVY